MFATTDVICVQNSSSHVAMLQSIVTVAMATVAIDDVVIPQGLFETAVVLHGKLSTLFCCLILLSS